MLFSIRAMKGIVQNDFNNKTNLQKHSKAHVVSKYTKLLAGHIEDPPQTETKKNTLDNNLQQWTMIMNYISVKQVFNILSFPMDKFWDK